MDLVGILVLLVRCRDGLVKTCTDYKSARSGINNRCCGLLIPPPVANWRERILWTRARINIFLRFNTFLIGMERYRTYSYRHQLQTGGSAYYGRAGEMKKYFFYVRLFMLS